LVSEDFGRVRGSVFDLVKRLFELLSLYQPVNVIVERSWHAFDHVFGTEDKVRSLVEDEVESVVDGSVFLKVLDGNGVEADLFKRVRMGLDDSNVRPSVT
jgi:hypothetical protein